MEMTAPSSDEEQDNPMRSKKKVKTVGGESSQGATTKNDRGDDFDTRQKIHIQGQGSWDESGYDDGS